MSDAVPVLSNGAATGFTLCGSVAAKGRFG